MIPEEVAKAMKDLTSKDEDIKDPKKSDKSKDVNIHIHMGGMPLGALGLGSISKKKKGLMLKGEKDGNNSNNQND